MEQPNHQGRKEAKQVKRKIRVGDEKGQKSNEAESHRGCTQPPHTLGHTPGVPECGVGVHADPTPAAPDEPTPAWQGPPQLCLMCMHAEQLLRARPGQVTETQRPPGWAPSSRSSHTSHGDGHRNQQPLSDRGPTQGLEAFPKGKARPLDPTHQATKDIQHTDHGSPSPGPVQVAAE